MARGVKLGTKRGCYKRFNKWRLRKLAKAIRAGEIDPQAVQQAFESTGRWPDRIIADQLRDGFSFDPERLASAVEALGVPQRKPTKKLPLWLAKAAMRHLQREYGGMGQPIHKALRAQYPYNDNAKVRAYHRRVEKDFGKRTKSGLDRRIDDVWPGRVPGRFPELEQGIRDSAAGLSVHGVPLELLQSMMTKRWPNLLNQNVLIRGR